MSQNIPTDPEKEEIEIELSEEAHAALLLLAKERGVTIDEIVEDILRRHIDKMRLDAPLPSEDTGDPE